MDAAVNLQPRLIEVAVPNHPVGAVLVLHGGASRRENMTVSPTQLSVLRMIPIARRIARVGRSELAVFRLLNSARGWDTQHTPIHDARWALDQIAERLSKPLPTCLVGHSLGGRAALLAANRPEVQSAVALAPWVYPTDLPTRLAGRQILIVHGTHDRIARPERSLALAQNLRAEARVSYISINGGKHAMIKHHRRFDGLAADFATATLLGTPATGAIARIQKGEALIQL